MHDSGPTDDLLVLTNIQSPYNAELYAALEQLIPLTVYYSSHPAAAGRSWRLPRQEWEHVGAPWTAETRAVYAHSSGPVILSGDYTSARSLLRLTITRRTSHRYFWGERLHPGTKFKRTVRRALLSGFDAVFAVGSWARDGYRDVVGEHVPVHLLPYVCSEREVARQPSAQPVVGFVGSLTPRKGLDILLRAVARMDDPPRVEVVGSGHQELDLRRLASDLEVPVRWLGELSTSKIDEVRRSWWLQTVPSRYDGWGVVVNESLATGVPVLASATTGAAHDMLDGRCGEIVRSADEWPSAITAWLARACSPQVTEAARQVAGALSAHNAAKWLVEVLRDHPATERNFVGEQLGG